jgi:hypothetical protein
VCPWRFDLATALRHSAPDEALELATTARTQADRFGSPTARGRALRTLATLQPPSAIPLLEESARILRQGPNRVEYARTLADLGAALTRAGHPTDARAPLTEARTLAAECDAPALHATVTQRLATIGVTALPQSPRANALNPRQRRVAQLAAQGRSEAEIAYTMVLDLTTVTPCSTTPTALFRSPPAPPCAAPSPDRQALARRVAWRRGGTVSRSVCPARHAGLRSGEMGTDSDDIGPCESTEE